VNYRGTAEIRAGVFGTRGLIHECEYDNDDHPSAVSEERIYNLLPFDEVARIRLQYDITSGKPSFFSCTGIWTPAIQVPVFLTLAAFRMKSSNTATRMQKTASCSQGLRAGM
jgi:hypothetical protein